MSGVTSSFSYGLKVCQCTLYSTHHPYIHTHTTKAYHVFRVIDKMPHVCKAADNILRPRGEGRGGGGVGKYSIPEKVTMGEQKLRLIQVPIFDETIGSLLIFYLPSKIKC